MLVIRLTRLPDINTDRDLERFGFSAYGRFAVLRNGSFWFGDTRSSHPQNCQTGWYWGCQDSVSGHNKTLDGEHSQMYTDSAREYHAF